MSWLLIQMLAGLVPTGLVSRIIARILRKKGFARVRAIAISNAASAVIAVAIGTWGFQGGQMDPLTEAVCSYVTAQFIWTIGDLLWESRPEGSEGFVR